MFLKRTTIVLLLFTKLAAISQQYLGSPDICVCFSLVLWRAAIVVSVFTFCQVWIGRF
jgi:hypothetical protein